MKKRTFAVCRAVAAVVLAAALLTGSGFAVGRLIGGAETISDAAELKNGAYVRAELTYIMDICGVERGIGGRPRAYYAVAPIGDQFVMVRFPASDLANAEELEARTQDFLQGTSSDIGFQLAVTGMAGNLSESAAQLLADWFNANGGWMSAAGVISEVPDYAKYLSGYMLASGRVGRVSRGAAIGMTAGAAALMLYAAAELTLVGMGRYGRRRADG